jgi:type IV pilus assembly protein PilA
VLSTWIQSKKDEEGFTLIELLVVVIIIGILAAIAIPTFLSQRERGWQAEVTSAVRNAALEVEAEATRLNGTYPDTAPAAVNAFFVRTGGNMLYSYAPITSGGNTVGFTLCGQHPQITGAHSVSYSTATRGMMPFGTAACSPAATAATAAS